MKINKFVSETLVQLGLLQARYTAMGVKGTQNPRNPYPMHTLVEMALPKLPSHDELIRIPLTISYVLNGKKIVDTDSKLLWQHEILGVDKWTKSAMTVEEIEDVLTNQGFKVSSTQSIRQALAMIPNVCKIPEPKEMTLKRHKGSQITDGRQLKSHNLYYIKQS